MLLAIKNFAHAIYVLWDQHGTKLIGFAGTALGTLALVDPILLRDYLGPRGLSLLLLLGGVLGAYRGFRNSQTALVAVAAAPTVIPPPTPGGA